MEKLISADALLIDLDEFEREYNANLIMRGLTVPDLIQIFRNTILKAEPAYNVEKVVEELEYKSDKYLQAYYENKNRNFQQAMCYDAKFIAYDDAIDIVKKGGVE